MKEFLQQIAGQPEYGKKLIEELLRAENMGRGCLHKMYLSPRQIQWLKDNDINHRYDENLNEWEITLN